MISVYSHFLDPIESTDTFEKPSTTIRRLRNAYNQGVTWVLDCKRTFVLNDDEVDDEILYEILRNKDLENFLRWFNLKIILVLDFASYETIGVRLRIATGMLNKLVYEGKLSKKLGIKIHNNFVAIVSSESSKIRTEDLPF